MDSDDFWASDDNLEILVGEAKRTPECDFIGFNCSYYYEVEDKVVPWVRYSEELAQPTSTERCVMMLLSSGTFPVSACMKLFRREALQGKIEFIKGAYCEDIPWFIELLRQTKRCRFINLYMYMYRKGVSTSISSSYSPKVYSDLLAHLERGVEQCQNWEVPSEFRDAILSLWAYELSILRAMTGYMDKEQQSVERNRLTIFCKCKIMRRVKRRRYGREKEKEKTQTTKKERPFLLYYAGIDHFGLRCDYRIIY
jgi:hypothetical protein